VTAEFSGPVVLKADFAAPARASDIDAVLLGIGDGADQHVRAAWQQGLDDRPGPFPSGRPRALLELAPRGSDRRFAF
jgi:hypothetical protein